MLVFPKEVLVDSQLLAVLCLAPRNRKLVRDVTELCPSLSKWQGDSGWENGNIIGLNGFWLVLSLAVSGEIGEVDTVVAVLHLFPLKWLGVKTQFTLQLNWCGSSALAYSGLAGNLTRYCRGSFWS